MMNLAWELASMAMCIVASTIILWFKIRSVDTDVVCKIDTLDEKIANIWDKVTSLEDTIQKKR